MSNETTKEKLYTKAKKIVVSDNNCSISYLQRTLAIGYNRASLIMDLLEKNGVISTPDKDGIRKVIL